MKRSPALQSQLITATLRGVAGTTHWFGAFIVLVFLVAFSWFSDQAWEIIKSNTFISIPRFLPLILFPAAFILLIIRYRRIAKQIVPDVDCEQCDRDSIQKVSCLILFLSPIGKDKEQIESWLSDNQKKGTIAKSREI